MNHILNSRFSFAPFKRVLATLILGIAAAAIHAAPEGSQVLDTLVFGDTVSERAHHFKGDSTAVVKGGLGEPARVANVTGAPAERAGDLAFTVKVDPAEQNYFTLKFWGEDTAGMTLVDIEGRQIGYRVNGDYESINAGHGKALPGRFYYSSILLPLDCTRGRETVELTLRTYLGKNMTASRGYYRAYTHTAASFDVSSEKQGEKLAAPATSLLGPDWSEAEKNALMERYRNDQISDIKKYEVALDKDPTAKISIERYKDELRYYSSSIAQPWSPAKTPAEKRRALERVFQCIDNHVRDYYADTKLVTRGGHQGDWGGYYGALGEALYIIEPLLGDHAIYGAEAFQRFLDQPFATNTTAGEHSLAGVDWDGGELSRREAWERVLKANFDFARSRLSYIYNQVLYTYEGAWEAHEGLRIIGSRFSEGKVRSHQILREALGLIPFLGEEVIVGPDGRDLDLYHSLFKHDREAQFTGDYLQIVAKGLAKSKLKADGKVVRRRPYGNHYIGITEAGLTRENGYVGTYGETANYFPEYFYRTLNHPGDEELNDDILRLALRNLHARAYTRYPSLDDEGHRIMRMEQVLDERKPVYPGLPAYATRLNAGRLFLYASLESYMAQHPERYHGPAWADTWRHATAAVGYAQQQLADHQFFTNTLALSATNAARKSDYCLPETYAYLTRDRADSPRFKAQLAAGVVHPLTDLDYYLPAEVSALRVKPADYTRFAWTDVENMMVVLRDGDVAISGIFNFRNRGFTGSGRLHVATPGYEHLAQVSTRAKFQYRDYYLRLNSYNFDYMVGNEGGDGPRPQALAGEICPITFQPGVGTVVRENFEHDHPYSALPDYLQSSYGRYFFVFNTTRPEHANVQAFEVEIPADHKSGTVLDLVSNRELPIRDGKVQIDPKTVLVLKLDSAQAGPTAPDGINFVAALPGHEKGVLTWKTAAGAASYTIKRADTEAGPYETIATSVQGNTYNDKTANSKHGYFYKVAAVNADGVAGWDSYRAALDFMPPVSLPPQAAPWRDDRIGAHAGKATVDGTSITIVEGDGTGLGKGDDYKIATRVIQNSLHFVSQPATGSFTLEARVDQAGSALAGLLVRDQLQPNTRYIYFGADSKGDLFLQNRTRDARHEVSMNVISPQRIDLPGYTVASHPHLRLVRDAATHEFHAFASKDGKDWTEVGALFTPFPSAVHAGLAAAHAALFSAVQLQPAARP